MRRLLPLLLLPLLSKEALAVRALPDDNLAYPVLLVLQSGGAGSGFFLNTATSTYLVTALHVLFDPTTRRPLSSRAELLSYSKDLKEPRRNRLALDLAALEAAGHTRLHSDRDVAVIRVAVSRPGSSVLALVPGVTALETAPLGITGVGLDSIKRYDEVLVANDVVVFGYPTSLGLKAVPQLDLSRPLLRKGIVAGLNPHLRSLVLDCPLYPGNSGGPVLELEQDSLGRRYWVIGVVREYVPYAEGKASGGAARPALSNSGYSIATPMDFVLELLTE